MKESNGVKVFAVIGLIVIALIMLSVAFFFVPMGIIVVAGLFGVDLAFWQAFLIWLLVSAFVGLIKK